MSWCRWVTDKAYGAAAFAYSQADYLLVSPLTAISKAIYQSESVSHICQGFNRVFRLPEILSISPQTREIVKQSVITNGEYLLNAVASERLIHKVYPHYEPIYSETVGMMLDWAVFVGFTARLFVRRILDNNCYVLSLPHAVSNDLAEYLAKAYAESLANSLWNGFKFNFFRHIDSHESASHYAQFANTLQNAFAEFISQREITLVSFKNLQRALIKTFDETITQAGSSESKEAITEFSKALANLVKDEFFNRLMMVMPSLAKKFEITVAKEVDDAAIKRRAKDKEALAKSMFKILVQSRAEQYADELIQSVIKVNVINNDNLQLWMPLNNIEACDCEKKKKIHASLSTSLYYTGNLVWLSLLRKAAAFLPDTQKTAALLALFLYQVIVYGQGFNEYKVVGDGQCTRHLYRVFSRNKAHSLGVGLSYALSVELLAKIVSLITEVDNLFTRDAIASVTLQLMTIATLADNKPLPGTGTNTWDIFSGSRKLTYKTAETIHSWFIPDLNNLESRQRCVERIKSILRSKEVGAGILYLFDGHNYYPSLTSLSEIKTLLGEKLYPFRDSIENKRSPDILVVVFNVPAVKSLLKLYQPYIDDAIPMLDNAHAWSKLLAWPLLSLPLPNALASTVTMPLLFLKDGSAYDLIRKLEAQMLILRAPVKQKKKLQIRTDHKPLGVINTLNVDEKHYAVKERSAHGQAPYQDAPADVKVTEIMPVVVALPENAEYRESDLNKIDGFDFTDKTPWTQREANKKDASGVVMFGMFAQPQALLKNKFLQKQFGTQTVEYELRRI